MTIKQQMRIEEIYTIVDIAHSIVPFETKAEIEDLLLTEIPNLTKSVTKEIGMKALVDLLAVEIKL